jgi:uncharacterized protein
MAALEKGFSSEWLARKCSEALSAGAGPDVAHDLEHIRRVVRSATRIGTSEGADLAVVIPAAWLHDCAAVSKSSPDRKRASRRSADVATRWLREWGSPERLLPDIDHAIESHSFSAAIEPRTLEAKVLQDADRLDALGAVGLARCLMLGGEMRRRLYNPCDPFCEERIPDDDDACIDHFPAKLLRLEGMMQTEAGRREARARTDFLRAFLEQLRSELA